MRPLAQDARRDARVGDYRHGEIRPWILTRDAANPLAVIKPQQGRAVQTYNNQNTEPEFQPTWLVRARIENCGLVRFRRRAWEILWLDPFDAKSASLHTGGLER